MAANTVPLVMFFPTYLRTRPQFIDFLVDSLFPAVDALGEVGVDVALPTFRQNVLSVPFFTLPPIWNFVEEFTPVDNGRDNYQVIFNANSVGISAEPAHWGAAVNGFPVPRVVSVRTMQQAHTDWWVWLRALASTHLAHPAMPAENVIVAALPLAPTRATRYSEPPIYPPSPN